LHGFHPEPGTGHSAYIMIFHDGSLTQRRGPPPGPLSGRSEIVYGRRGVGLGARSVGRTGPVHAHARGLWCRVGRPAAPLGSIFPAPEALTARPVRSPGPAPAASKRPIVS
jgi:hypothetical protein